jgi:alkylation response protein AidB-like acyl-CoA dehydrogenase
VRPIILLDGEHEVNEVFFDNVEVPAENLIGEENKGWTYAKHLLSHERTNIADVNRAKRELERLKRIAKAEGVWDDNRFRDQIALLEVDIVALEMMVLRVLSAEKSGKQSLDVAGLLKIRGSEIQQRYTELMMLAAARTPSAFIHEAMEAGWQGDYVARPHLRAAGRHLLQHAQDHHLRRQQRGAAQHRLASRSGELNMDFEFTEDQLSLRDAVAPLGGQGLQLRAPPRAGQGRRCHARRLRELAELGLTGLAVPEAHGGMGFGAVEAMVVMEELGRGLVNAPYTHGALVAPAPAGRRAGRRAGHLVAPEVADASALVVLAHQERGAATA